MDANAIEISLPGFAPDLTHESGNVMISRFKFGFAGAEMETVTGHYNRGNQYVDARPVTAWAAVRGGDTPLQEEVEIDYEIDFHRGRDLPAVRGMLRHVRRETDNREIKYLAVRGNVHEIVYIALKTPIVVPRMATPEERVAYFRACKAKQQAWAASREKWAAEKAARLEAIASGKYDTILLEQARLENRRLLRRWVSGVQNDAGMRVVERAQKGDPGALQSPGGDCYERDEYRQALEARLKEIFD